MVEDVDGPMGFLPVDIDEQLAQVAAGGGPLTSMEIAAGEAWVETIANAIAKLTFALPDSLFRVGLAVQAQLDESGRRVVGVRDGARVADLPGALDKALRGRNVQLAAPLGPAISMGAAWAIGESRAVTGGLVGIGNALVLTWSDEVTWSELCNAVPSGDTVEPRGTAFDLGFWALSEASATRCGTTERLLVASRGGSECVSGLLEDAARCLGARAGSRIMAAIQRGDAVPERVVLGGSLGRAALDTRLGAQILDRFCEGARAELSVDVAGSRAYGILAPSGGDAHGDASGDPDVADVHAWQLADGFVHVSREDAAAVIGAAYAAQGTAQRS